LPTIVLALAGLALAVAQLSLQADAAENASSLMNVKVPAALIAKANDPKPPANASQKTSIGRGKTFYVYDENHSLVCADGSPATADLLIAINGKGNPRNRPAGSGFYVVSLDATECKAEATEAYGCRFDGKGNPTVCGVVEVDDKNDDVVIATASK